MDSAKAKIKDFLSSSGQHDTTVHETTAAPVTKEQVTRTEHENVNTAIDKEVHKDHYHTTVQPVQDTATLPEQHHTKVLPVESRSFEHDNADDVQRGLAEQNAQFKDERHHVEGQHTSANVPVVAGEHRHHHVHETIQPVIERQTIEPHVVHTTVPVHEVHHDVSQHHAGSTLPAMTMDEFQQKNHGDVRTQHFKGEPQLATVGAGGHGANTIGSGLTGHSGHGANTTGSGLTGHSGHGANTTGSGLTGHSDHGANTTGSGLSDRSGLDASGSNTAAGSTTGAKPSLMDKLNPRKDADGDGKAGLMD